VGKPGFPMSQPLLGASGNPQAGRWGNPVSPCPNRCWERLAPPRREDGETRFPHFPTAVGDVWHPPGRGTGKPGFPVSQPLVGAASTPPRQGCGSTGSPQVGKPGFLVSQPLVGAAGAPPPGRGAVRQAHRRWGNPVSPCPNRWWERLAPPQARGLGKPGFPVSQPLVGASGTPQAEGWGNPVSPYFHLRIITYL